MLRALVFLASTSSFCFAGADLGDRIRSLSAAPGTELRTARETLGMSQADFAIALGYHDRQGLRQQVYEMETGRKAITPQTARLAEMLRRFGVPEEFLAES
jgi:transcriptional regulator with XRE-family HTH domain